MLMGLFVGNKVREISRDIMDTTLDPNREDELTDIFKDVASTGLGIDAGLEVFDLFDED